jgi:hypothetical protein
MVEQKLEITFKNLIMNQVYCSFSVCTLVKNKEKYQILLESLQKNNFCNDIDEILCIDNSLGNNHDCFSAIKKFVSIAKKNYIILAHDDIVFNLDRKVLVRELEKKKSLDPKSAVFGVAGVYKNPLVGSGHFISHKGEENWGFRHNGKVNTLDECCIIIDKASLVSVSDKITGYHFYGTDICINARKKGFSTYVIDYPITHKSKGNLDAHFLRSRQSYISHLRKNGNWDVVTTTCTSMYAGNDFFKKVKSLSIAIVKPILGENEKAEFVKESILGDLIDNPVLRICVIIYSNALICKHKIYFDAIYPRTWILRRMASDISWWRKNWRSRFCS